MSLDEVLTARPVPGHPRPYRFPEFDRDTLANGLEILTADLPGRPLVSASLIVRQGAVDEPPDEGGASVLAARALSEGTENYDAIALVEATERLGTSLRSEASWDATSAGLEVVVDRLEPALELLAELVRRPTFPASDVERLRDERLNDILQARADPRRRVEEALVDTIYTSGSAYHRPPAGLPETVATLDAAVLRRTHDRGLDPSRAAMIVAGDLGDVDIGALVGPLFGDWVGPPEGGRPEAPIVAESAVESTRVRLVHRPGAVQSELRIGHVGAPRRIDDFHPLAVMSAILGGLFNSRLNMKLREEKGYTYGAGAGFDLRRAAGPFTARAAVNTEVTVPAIADMLAELRRIGESPVTDAEIAAARDYLVGVFPLRFETPGPVVGALGGIFVHQLPDDELARYRPAIEAVGVDDVLDVARRRLDPDRLAIVVVGDADAVGSDLERAGFGPVEVVSDDPATVAGRADDEG